MKNAMYRIFALFTSFVLFSCGGGGGDDVTPTNPPTEPPPVSAPTGLITTQKAEVLVSYPLSIIESVYQVAQLINPKITSDLVTINGFFTDDCEVAGDYSINHTDTDSSGNLTPGDTLQLNFVNCVPKFTEQAINGTATISVLNSAFEITGYAVNLALQASDSEGTVEISTNSINIETIASNFSTQTNVRTVQDPFVIGIENLEDSFSALDLTYTYDQTTLRYDISFDFEVTSQILELDFSCESTSSMRGLVFQTPNDYAYQCDASANDNISVTRNLGSTDSVYSYTSGGARSDIIGVNDRDFFEGSIGFALGVAPETEFANTALAITLDASNWPQQEAPRPEQVAEVLYDDNKQIAYVVSTVFDSAAEGIGSVIQAINVEDMTLIQSQRITSDTWITRTELSANRAFLYAFADSQGQSLVYIIDTADLSIVDTVDVNLHSSLNSFTPDSVYIESMLGEANTWIISYSTLGSNENEFLVFNGSELSSRGVIEGQFDSNVLYSESSGVLLVLGINGNNSRNIAMSRYFINADGVWERLSFAEVQNAELGSTAPNGQFEMPVLEVSGDFVITEYGYVFSRTDFELLAKLDLDKPAVSSTSGIIFEANGSGLQNLYGLSDLAFQRRNFAYETPFSRNPWILYQGTQELFFYAAGDQLIRVGVLLFD